MWPKQEFFPNEWAMSGISLGIVPLDAFNHMPNTEDIDYCTWCPLMGYSRSGSRPQPYFFVTMCGTREACKRAQGELS